ncbi:MAG: MopE-related protein [Kofleriaceae bacterium]
MRALYLPFVLGLMAACGPSGGRGTCTDAENCDMGPCNPGDARACYTGHEGTEGVGPCMGGNQTCLQGGNWGDCVGQVVPAPEVCGDNVDNNCNGMTDEDVDQDGDGYTTCGGDCCDSTECSDPASVNPGAFEVPGDGVDNDCDGMIDNAVPLCDTGLAANSSTAMDYAKAIDLCQTATMADKKWGVIDAQLTLTDGTGAPDAKSRSIRPKFGTNTMPQLGGSMAVISSGVAAAMGDAGWVNPQTASYMPGTSSPYPADFLAANGGMLPNAPGCPKASGTKANDPVMLTVKVRVPTNAHSFSIKSNFFSSEFPEWTCSKFNDFFVILLDSTYNGNPANPADKNLAFYTPPNSTMNYPVGVNLAHGDTGLFTECKNGGTGCALGATVGTISTCVNTIDLAGTGFDLAGNGCDTSNLVGGATGWLTTTGNVVPGEIMTLRIAIWDTSDEDLDSLALIDAFTWSAVGSDPGTVIERTVEPIQPVSPATGLALPTD